MGICGHTQDGWMGAEQEVEAEPGAAVSAAIGDDSAHVEKGPGRPGSPQKYGKQSHCEPTSVP